MSTSTTPRLDHIIILLPHADLLNPPTWLTENFTLYPGGKHSDGLTENKLILLADGSYIELIAFIDDSAAARATHWWGGKKYGIVDFALTSEGDAGGNYEGLREGLKGWGGKYGYLEPQKGGRKRADGVEVKWEVTFPKGERGVLPFFCHDVTERGNRVPGDREWCTHACGAYGLSSLTVVVKEEVAKEVEGVYGDVVGLKDAGGKESGKRFKVERVKDVSGARHAEIWVKGASDENGPVQADVAKYGIVLKDLILWASSSSNKQPSRLSFGNDYLQIGVDVEPC